MGSVNICRNKQCDRYNETFKNNCLIWHSIVYCPDIIIEDVKPELKVPCISCEDRVPLTKINDTTYKGTCKNCGTEVTLNV